MPKPIRFTALIMLCTNSNVTTNWSAFIPVLHSSPELHSSLLRQKPPH